MTMNRCQPLARCISTRFHQLPGVWVEARKIAGFTRLHHIVQGIKRFFERCIVVKTADFINIDIVCSQSLKAIVYLRHNRLARQAHAVGTGRMGANTLSAMTTSSRAVSKSRMARPSIRSVSPLELVVGDVKEIDAIIHGQLDETSAALHVQMSTGGR